MAVVVKPVEHLHTVTGGEKKRGIKCKTEKNRNFTPKMTKITNYSLLVVWIFLTDLLQHLDFQFGCFSVFLHILNDLQSCSASTSTW